MVASHNNVIVGGALHCICGNTCFAFIGGGCDNCVRGDSGACGQVIVGGHLTQLSQPPPIKAKQVLPQIQ
jgi:hypothetical protein